MIAVWHLAENLCKSGAVAFMAAEARNLQSVTYLDLTIRGRYMRMP
jgi:hypothetical protein